MSNTSVKQILSLRLMNWPIDRVLRRLARSVPRDKNVATQSPLNSPSAGTSGKRDFGFRLSNFGFPLVLVRAVAKRQIVMAVSCAATTKGITPGMTLAQARALCADVVVHDYDPVRDIAGLESLGRYLHRFTPVVMPVPADEQADLEHGIFLDLTGCAAAFGGLDHLIGPLLQSLARLRIDCRWGIGPNPAAAWAMSFRSSDGIESSDHLIIESLIQRPDDSMIQSSLPLRALRLPVATRQTLEHLGVHIIGDLLRLPPATLPSRFGPIVGQRVDQLLGRRGEPLVPLPFISPIEQSIEFDGPAPSTESLERAAEMLLPGLLDQLRRRQQGARRIELRILRADTPPIDKLIDLSHPTRNPKTIVNLIRCALESLSNSEMTPTRTSSTPLTAGRSTRGGNNSGPRELPSAHLISAGFLGLSIRLPDPQSLPEEQMEIHTSDRGRAVSRADALVELLAHLGLRLGDGALVRPMLVESHLPEKAFTLSTQLDDPTGQSSCAGITRRKDPHPNPPQFDAAHRWPEHQGTGKCPRPLRLLWPPMEIRVMVSPSHDRDGRPIAFTLDGNHYPVMHHTGPERIAGQWWTGHLKTRDYFDVQTPQGYRFWIFRVLETARWYLHGTFC